MDVNRGATSQFDAAARSTSDLGRESARKFFPDVALMAHALDAGDIGVWSWAVADDKVIWSSNLEKLHRLAPGSFDGTFATFERDIHPDDRAMVMAAIKDSVESRRPYSVTYRLPPQEGQEDRWIAAAGSVLVDGESQVRLFGICRDVSSRVRTEHELRMRAQRQEAVARLGARALVEDDLQKLLDDITAIVATVLDVDLADVLELVSGDTELLFRSGYGWKPDLIGRQHIPVAPGSHASYTLAAPVPVVITDLKSETRFTPSAILMENGVISSMATTIVGHDNRTYGIFSIHTRRPRAFNEYDLSLLNSIANIIAGAIQRRELDQRQKMMIRELHHRSGNLFSQVLSLFSQTASNSKSITELVSKYEARVFALANAHRLLTEAGWQSASLMELFGTQMAPCLDRVSLNGPNVYLEPASAFAISTVTHELVSNAIKHGSLSALEGRVDVNWSVDRSERGTTMVLDWRERGGPPPRRAIRSGFGSRLIDTVIERQMNGQVRRTFHADGLRCRLVIPLANERWPEAPVPEPKQPG